MACGQQCPPGDDYKFTAPKSGRALWQSGLLLAHKWQRRTKTSRATQSACSAVQRLQSVGQFQRACVTSRPINLASHSYRSFKFLFDFLLCCRLWCSYTGHWLYTGKLVLKRQHKSLSLGPPASTPKSEEVKMPICCLLSQGASLGVLAKEAARHPDNHLLLICMK